MANQDAAKRIKVTLTRSPISSTWRQKEMVKSLGLRRMNQSIEHTDTPTIRGMIARVSHLLTVEEVKS